MSLFDRAKSQYPEAFPPPNPEDYLTDADFAHLDEEEEFLFDDFDDDNDILGVGIVVDAEGNMALVTTEPDHANVYPLTVEQAYGIAATIATRVAG